MEFSPKNNFNTWKVRAVKKIEGPFDIIFDDPTYDNKNISEVLSLAEKNNLFHDQSLIFYEHSKNQEPIKNIGKLSNIKSKNYGDTSITLFKLEEV